MKKRKFKKVVEYTPSVIESIEWISDVNFKVNCILSLFFLIIISLGGFNNYKGVAAAFLFIISLGGFNNYKGVAAAYLISFLLCIIILLGLIYNSREVSYEEVKK